MELAIFVAKIFGVIYLALGLGVLINSNYYKKVFQDLLHNTAFVLIGGAASLAIGIAIILGHNVWESSWVILVTIIGWLAIVKGALLLVLPRSVSLFESWYQNKSFITLTGVGALILGAVLCYFGFLA